MERYTCEWERLNSVTRTMTETKMRAHYKAHSIAGDCAFALRPGAGATVPMDILAGWRALQSAIDASDGRESVQHRTMRDQLRAAWRNASQGWPYTVPAISQPVRKTRSARCCPNCGYSAAA